MAVEFQVIKMMNDDDVVEYRRKVINWLIERLGEQTFEYDTEQMVLSSENRGDKWSVSACPIMGKYHNWSMHYTITIDDDIIAVEFALVKDAL